MNVGKYTTRNNCRFCKSENISLVIDFGLMPLAGDFLKKEELGKEFYYPLRIFLCNECYLVQVLDVIPPEVLFKDYRYMSSIGLTKHFESYAKDLFNKYLKKDDFVVEIGSNDGVLLLPMQKLGLQVLGIDPAENIAKIASAKGVETLPTFFDSQIAREVVSKYRQANAIVANNVLAHIDDMDEIMRGIDILLDKNGVLIFEVHYLVKLINELQYDFFYQEHLCYYSLTALIPYLKKFGFKIFDVNLVPTHSGSIRIFAKRINNKKYSSTKALRGLQEEEEKLKIDKIKTYTDFMKHMHSHRDHVRKTIQELLLQNKKIIGYGASGRANTLLNFCGIGSKSISYVVDSSPERYGRYMPQSHIPIVSPEKFHKDSIDSVIILAWNYAEMILEKERDYLIGKDIYIPLPQIKKIIK